MPQKPIKETLYTLELEVVRQKAVLAAFPDAKVSAYGEFTSKTVNQSYTSLVFNNRWQSLYVMPHCQVDFMYDGKDYNTYVHSAPMKQRIAYVSWDYKTKGSQVRFSRLAINMKSHQFRTDMISDCQTELVGFLKKFSNLPINDKHLDPRLKKLISFL